MNRIHLHLRAKKIGLLSGFSLESTRELFCSIFHVFLSNKTRDLDLKSKLITVFLCDRPFSKIA